MASSEFHKTMIHHLLEGERGQQKALEIFLQSATDVKKALETLFLIENTQRRVSQDRMQRFVKLLPQAEWIIFACDQMLLKPNRWDTWAVAIVLRNVMAYSTGKNLMLAEICWIERLSFCDRAIASSAPVTITSALGDNALYVGGDSYNYDKNNRSPYCWKAKWTPDNKKDLWRLIPAQTGSCDVYLVNVYAEGYLNASDIPGIDDDGFSTKNVLVRCESVLADETGVWRLVKLGRNTCAFYNACQDTYLCSPLKTSDGFRREVVTSTFRPLDEKISGYREWKISPTALSLMEMGLYEFFTRQYERAVQTFNAILLLEKNRLC